jgi:hypothetical protein
VGDSYFLELVEAMMTPDEGQILLELSMPLAPADLAKKMGLDEKKLTAKLENLATKLRPG